MDFSRLQHPSTSKQTGPDEYHAPCPSTGAGKDTFWYQPEAQRIGCRTCGDASGRLNGETLEAHARPLGVWTEAQAERKTWDSWWLTTADGRRRKQLRAPDGSKPLSKNKDPKRPMPVDLLYARQEPFTVAGPVVLVEGASSADALLEYSKLGTLRAYVVAHLGGKTGASSLARFPAGCEFTVWPDHDAPGYRQALAVADVAKDSGFAVDVLDPVKLYGGEPPRDSRGKAWDPGNWTPKTADALDEIRAAVIPLDELRAREAVPAAVVGQAAGDVVELGPRGAHTRYEAVELALEAIGVEHRYNTRADRCEWRERDGGPWDWKARNDRVVEDWRLTVIPERCTFTITKKDQDLEVPARFTRPDTFAALEGHARRHEVDPFREWLEALPAWDGRTRNWLSGCFPSLEGNELGAWASTSVPLAAVRRTYEPGARVHEVPVIQGRKQGTGKSSALAWLMPVERRHEWFTDGLSFGQSTKELVEGLQGRVLCEFSEMAGSTRADTERIKAWLTSPDDGSVRLAYRRDPEPRPRRAVFLGTTNSQDCLPNDPTGNRRFVMLPVLEEASGHARHVTEHMDREREMVWAEAIARYKQGEGSHLPENLKGLVDANNEDFRSADEGAEGIVGAFLRSERADRFGFMDLRRFAKTYPDPPSDGKLDWRSPTASAKDSQGDGLVGRPLLEPGLCYAPAASA